MYIIGRQLNVNYFQIKEKLDCVERQARQNSELSHHEIQEPEPVNSDSSQPDLSPQGNVLLEVFTLFKVKTSNVYFIKIMT